MLYTVCTVIKLFIKYTHSRKFNRWYLTLQRLAILHQFDTTILASSEGESHASQMNIVMDWGYGREGHASPKLLLAVITHHTVSFFTLRSGYLDISQLKVQKRYSLNEFETRCLSISGNIFRES